MQQDASNHIESLCDTKVVVVGDCKSGKSALIDAFVANTVVEPVEDAIYGNLDDSGTHYEPTQGSRFLKAPFPDKSGNFAIFDTSGDHEDTVRRWLYSHTKVVIITFSLGDIPSLENVLDFWAPEVTRRCPDASILLAGTHCDLPPRNADNVNFRKVAHDQAIAISDQIGAAYYVEISSTAWGTVNQLFEKVVLALAVKPPLRQEKSPLAKAMTKTVTKTIRNVQNKTKKGVQTTIKSVNRLTNKFSSNTTEQRVNDDFLINDISPLQSSAEVTSLKIPTNRPPPLPSSAPPPLDSDSDSDGEDDGPLYAEPDDLPLRYRRTSKGGQRLSSEPSQGRRRSSSSNRHQVRNGRAKQAKQMAKAFASRVKGFKKGLKKNISNLSQLGSKESPASISIDAPAKVLDEPVHSKNAGAVEASVKGYTVRQSVQTDSDVDVLDIYELSEAEKALLPMLLDKKTSDCEQKVEDQKTDSESMMYMNTRPPPPPILPPASRDPYRSDSEFSDEEDLVESDFESSDDEALMSELASDRNRAKRASLVELQHNVLRTRQAFKPPIQQLKPVLPPKPSSYSGQIRPIITQSPPLVSNPDSISKSNLKPPILPLRAHQHQKAPILPPKPMFTR